MKNVLPLVLLFGSLFSIPLSAQTPLYKDASAPISARVSDLLGRMTPEEKVGQLRCLFGFEMFGGTGKNDYFCSPKFMAEMQGQCPPGSLWATLRSDAWTKRDLQTGLYPRSGAETLNKLQKVAVEQTRLGIPLFFAEEAAHGLMAIGHTTLPTGLLMASTWDIDLMRHAGQLLGSEAHAQGVQMNYGPVLDIARDARWSRMEEGLGEDTYLTGAIGSALVEGMQTGTPACLKHFAAFGVSRGGRHGGPADVGERQLRDELLPPFEKAVRVGAKSLMVAYNTIDGIPCTAHRHLLRDILRTEWGFDGLVLSDAYSIDGLRGTHRLAKRAPEAAAMAMNAGVDIDLGGNYYDRPLLDALSEGLVNEAEIDSAVARVLRFKFEAGLFEHPYADPDAAEREAAAVLADSVAYHIAQEGLILLKNNGVLPIEKGTKRVALIGPNADRLYNQLGDYTAPQTPGKTSTPLSALRARQADMADFTYVRGCAVRDTTTNEIDAAVEAARAADVAVVVVGGSSAREDGSGLGNDLDELKKQTLTPAVGDMDCGEGFDRSTLRLLGLQERLVREVVATGTPTVVVLISGRPLDLSFADANAAAVICAWYPGEQGGRALADVLFGDVNPSGKLPVSMPRTTGQLPVYYAQTAFPDYTDGPTAPLYPFGHGLSYTTFAYSNLSISKADGDGALVRIGCDITNTGSRDGCEVAQLYVRDDFASVARAPKRLCGFARVQLKAGETKHAEFAVSSEDLALFNASMERVVEAGDFSFFVGSSSNDIRLESHFTIDRDILLAPALPRK